MEYHEIPPSHDLRQIVKCYWTLRQTGVGAPPAPEKILPDGCCEIVIHRADSFHRQGQDGTCREQPRVLIAGQLEKVLEVVPSGKIDLFGVRFHPTGLHRLTGLAVSEIRGLQVDPGDLSGDLGRSLRELEILPPRGLVTRVEEILRRHSGAARGSIEAVERAVELIEESQGGLSLEEVARLCEMSRRQLERLFPVMVGLRPKQFARIVRFQGLLDRIDVEGPRNWSSLALRCGYFDQSHMIREFRSLAGQSPAAHFAGDHPLAAHISGTEAGHPSRSDLD